MPCYAPLRGFVDLDEPGRVVFRHPEPGSSRYQVQWVPCRMCVGCMQMQAGDWTTRCYCESKVHERNAFVTLTYDDEHLPPHRMLRKRDMTLFLKRLRRRFGSGIRFFYVGEYGTRTYRPHYHVCLFGVDFDDKVHARKSQGGFDLYESKTLSELWGQGLATTQDLTPETAAYAARYCVKKRERAAAQAKPDARRGYVKKEDRAGMCVDRVTGELYRFVPEFCQASLKPAIGIPFLEKFFQDVWNAQGVVMPDGHIAPIPTAFMNQIRKWREADYQEAKRRRRDQAFEYLPESMPRRLQDRATVARARLSLSKRDGV